MTNEQVNEMEEALREAEAKVEKACQLMCNEPQDTDGKREVWASMQQALAHIDVAVHGAYLLRPEEQQQWKEEKMSPNTIEALGEIIGKIQAACDEKHGWIKDKEVAHWLVDNIAVRMVMVQGQISNSAGEPDSGCAGTEEKKDFVLFDKYKIEHTDGTPLKGKRYFVLRLDSEKPEEKARVSAAMRAYLGKDPDKAIQMLHKVHDWLGVIIRDGKCDDHCHECIGASDLADDVWDVLHPEGLPLPVDRPADCPAKGKPCPMAEENKAKVAPSPSKLEDTVREIVCEQLGVNMEQVVPEASFMDDLGADSLDCVELVMAMEEEFGIPVPEEDAEKLTTVGKAMDYLRAKGF